MLGKVEMSLVTRMQLSPPSHRCNLLLWNLTIPMETVSRHKWPRLPVGEAKMEVNEQFELASPGHRIAAAFVDMGLYVVTLGIGWFIWNLVMWGQGQTPAKSLLKIRVVDEKRRKPANWGHMFVRQALIPAAISLVLYIPYVTLLATGITVGFGVFSATAFILCICLAVAIYVTDFVWLFGPRRRRLIDYWAKALVINEANAIPQYGLPVTTSPTSS